MGECLNKLMVEWADGLIEGCMESMDGLTDGGTDG